VRLLINLKVSKFYFLPIEKVFDFLLIIPPVFTLYLCKSEDFCSTLLIIAVYIVASLFIVFSIMSNRTMKMLSGVCFISLISLLLSLVINESKPEESIYPGQNIQLIKTVTAIVLEDSREISGGQSIFPIELYSTENINSTQTSASGRLMISSRVKLFKGQVISIQKSNIFSNKSLFLFINQENISFISWVPTGNFEIWERRASLINKIQKKIHFMPENISILFKALFLGIKNNPKGEIFTVLRQAGASHILALSGMHLGIISFGIMFGLSFFLNKRISFLFTFFAIVFYVFIVGSGPSLSRAAILFTLLGIYSLTGFRVDIFHLLVISFLLQLMWNPSVAYELSFQLSYLALGGIILGSSKISRILPGFIPSGIRGILGASLAAQISTAPLVLHSFGVIYPVGIISGIILVPLITIFIWTGILGLLPLSGFLKNIIFNFLSILYKAIKFCADLFSNFPSIGESAAVYSGIILIVLLLVYFLLHSKRER
jgi:ComEC/Rec2-related protein